MIETRLCRPLVRTPDAETLYAVDKTSVSRSASKHPQDVREQIPWDPHLRHLERDAAGVINDLHANCDQLFPERRQRPVFDRLWRRQHAQEIENCQGCSRTSEGEGARRWR